MKIGIVHGRFQPFHNGHLEYVLQALTHCDRLVIGITNPDPGNTKFDASNTERAKEENNPFTYFERLEMIKNTLREIGVPDEKFDIVPFPINFPEKLKYYIPKDAVHFTRVYEPWNLQKIKLLENEGYTVNVLYSGTPEDKSYTYSLPIGVYGKPGSLEAISGTEIRECMATGGDWEKYVPDGTARVILKRANILAI